MCMKCDGMSEDEVRQWYLDSIEQHGWTICAVEGGDGAAPFAYTIGLTRYHDPVPPPHLLAEQVEDLEGPALVQPAHQELGIGGRGTGAGPAGVAGRTPTGTGHQGPPERAGRLHCCRVHADDGLR